MVIYNSGILPTVIVFKDIHYTCGCIVTIGGWGANEAELYCEEHRSPIAKIVTTEEYRRAALAEGRK